MPNEDKLISEARNLLREFSLVRAEYERLQSIANRIHTQITLQILGSALNRITGEPLERSPTVDDLKQAKNEFALYKENHFNPLVVKIKAIEEQLSILEQQVDVVDKVEHESSSASGEESVKEEEIVLTKEELGIALRGSLHKLESVEREYLRLEKVANSVKHFNKDSPWAKQAQDELASYKENHYDPLVAETQTIRKQLLDAKNENTAAPAKNQSYDSSTAGFKKLYNENSFDIEELDDEDVTEVSQPRP